MIEKLKKQTYIVEETKGAVNETEESECKQFQPKVIQILVKTEKPKKRTYENFEVEDHEENISPLTRILLGKENDQSNIVS